MLTDIQAWLRQFENRLRETFPERIAFLGLQGSRSRGEETPESDIDVVVVLDSLAPEDIRRYRAMLDTLPERALICGFLSGWEELSRWEPSDLFQFCHDTTPVIGSLDALLRGIAPEDVARAVRIGACNIYHGCVHTMCHGRSGEHLKELFKASVFVLQARHFLRTGDYVRRKADLLPALTGADARVLETAMRLRDGEPVAFEPMAEQLFAWAQGVIAPPWHRQETARFILHFSEDDREIMERMARRADETYERVARAFDIPPAAEKFDFWLCPDVRSFMDLTGKGPETYQAWMVGNADYEKRRLCVLSPRTVRDRTMEAMEQVVSHEIVHIAMDALCPGDKCPIWLSEGIATLWAGQVAPDADRPVPRIAGWTDGIAFADNAGYDYAGVYVWYYMEKYGAERFRRVYAGEDAGLYPGFEEEAVAAWQASGQGVTANPAG